MTTTIGQLILMAGASGGMRADNVGPDFDSLPCDGRVLNVADYASLYALIGTNFGAAPGGFQIPSIPNPPGVKSPGGYFLCCFGTSPTTEPEAAALGRVERFVFQHASGTPATIPSIYHRCDGARFDVSKNQALYALLGNAYGGDNFTFLLPNVSSQGASEWMPNDGYAIAVGGLWPSSRTGEEFVAQIVLGKEQRDNMPSGMLPCDGRLLPISQWAALFSVIGFSYGGDNRSNFALPNLKPPAGLEAHAYYIMADGIYPSG